MLAQLLDPKNIAELDAILEYHVITGAAIRAEDLKASQDVKTFEGQEVHITKSGGSVTVESAKVVQPNVGATNGVVHIINGVLIPPTMLRGSQAVSIMANISIAGKCLAPCDGSPTGSLACDVDVSPSSCNVCFLHSGMQAQCITEAQQKCCEKSQPCCPIL